MSEENKPVNPLERRVDLIVSLEELNQLMDSKLKKIQPNVKLQGFRKGKVPLSMVRQMHGQQAYGEAFNSLIQQAFSEKIKDEPFRVVAAPMVEPKQSEDEKHLHCTAIFEVFPEFELADLSDVAITRPVFEVSDKEVDKTLSILQKQRVKYEVVERAAQKEDRVFVDFLGTKEGEPFEGGKGENYPFVVGAGMMLKEFEDNVEGLKKGDEKDFPLTFPQEYFQKDLAGKQVSFHIKVNEVAAPNLPEINDDFAKLLGIQDGIAQLKKEIKENLTREVKARLLRQVKQQVMDALIEKNPVDLPQALVQMETERLVQSAKDNMKKQGIAHDKINVQASWFEKDAARRVHLGLILAKIVDSKTVEVQKEDVRRLIDEMAASYEKPEELVRWYYEKPERLKNIEGLALEEKVVDWGLNSANVTEEAADFDELMKDTP